MSKFDLQEFFRDCESGVAELKKEEERKHPEYRLFLKSPKQINDEFKKALDEIKMQAGIFPGEVYISSSPDGSIAVNLGETLLKIEVLFRVTLNVRSASRKSKKTGKPFSFEHMVAREYDRCVREYELFRQEIKRTWKASDVPSDELEQAICLLEDVRQDAFKRFAAFRRNNCLDGSQKAETEVNNLTSLLQKLKKLSPRRA